MSNLQLLVLHVPKTGGSSLKTAVRRRYRDRLLKDYADPCFSQERVEAAWASGFPALAGKQAVIGHFSALKYQPLEVERRVTVLRHPLERAISHFFHYLSVAPRSPAWRAVHEREMGFVELVAQPDVRWIYTRVYFPDTDMAGFEVVDHDRLFADWDAITGRWGLTSPIVRAQDRSAVLGDYAAMREALRNDAAQMNQARELLADDIAFYQACIEAAAG